MSWLTDQINLNDVSHVIQCFYNKARTDPKIGHFFAGIDDFTEHEKRIAAFWWLALGGQTKDLPGTTPSFDMINKHLALGIADSDLEVWLLLFKQTLDEELENDYARAWQIKLDEIARHLKALVIDGNKPAGIQITETKGS